MVLSWFVCLGLIVVYLIHHLLKLFGGFVNVGWTSFVVCKFGVTLSLHVVLVIRSLCLLCWNEIAGLNGRCLFLIKLTVISFLFCFSWLIVGSGVFCWSLIESCLLRGWNWRCPCFSDLEDSIADPVMVSCVKVMVLWAQYGAEFSARLSASLTFLTQNSVCKPLTEQLYCESAATVPGVS